MIRRRSGFQMAFTAWRMMKSESAARRQQATKIITRVTARLQGMDTADGQD
jgi:hypothetical protein